MTYDVASMVLQALGTVVTVAAAGLLAVPLSDRAACLGMTVDVVDPGQERPARPERAMNSFRRRCWKVCNSHLVGCHKQKRVLKAPGGPRAGTTL
jgi:hypothetical protein